MVIYLIDDEPLQLRLLNTAVLEAEPEAEVHNFMSPKQLLRALAEGDTPPDVAFLDIEMPGMGGIELGKRLMELCPHAFLIFVTGYPQYALDAFDLHASAYVVKPVTTERVREELDRLTHALERRPKRRIRVQCFGNFEVFVDGKPLRFEGSKTRELLAYLVDRQGAVANTGELCAILWEDEPDTAQLRKRLRKYLSYLTSSLHGAGADELLVKHFNSFAVATDSFDCDYYDYLNGVPGAAYRGEYMSQYSWAETTLAALEMK